ncbi:MAG: 4Fe-4S binding protein, partial [Dehalococcoidales bacterium]|nr:4Fe-4S binding protein [Dehalococcoidales bacterium]
KKVVEADIKDLYEKGWVFPTKKGPLPPRSYAQWIDTQNHPKFEKSLGREYFDLLRMIGENDAQTEREEKVANEPLVGSRIIPRWKAIKDIPGVLPVEDVREIIKSKELYAVVECACRKRYPERECKVPEEICIVMDATAKYNIERGSGRQLTRQQVLDMIDDTAKYPTFHIGTPAADPQSFFGLICNCHWCCCAPRRPGFLPNAKYTPQKYDRKSRFEAAVDLEKCTGCKICVEKRCQFNAAQMKFYPEYGKEKAYVDAELCMGCGNCVETCPTGARLFKLVRPVEWVTEGPQKNLYAKKSLG